MSYILDLNFFFFFFESTYKSMLKHPNENLVVLIMIISYKNNNKVQ